MSTNAPGFDSRSLFISTPFPAQNIQSDEKVGTAPSALNEQNEQLMINPKIQEAVDNIEKCNTLILKKEAAIETLTPLKPKNEAGTANKQAQIQKFQTELDGLNTLKSQWETHLAELQNTEPLKQNETIAQLRNSQNREHPPVTSRQVGNAASNASQYQPFIPTPEQRRQFQQNAADTVKTGRPINVPKTQQWENVYTKMFNNITKEKNSTNEKKLELLNYHRAYINENESKIPTSLKEKFQKLNDYIQGQIENLETVGGFKTTLNEIIKNYNTNKDSKAAMSQFIEVKSKIEAMIEFANMGDKSILPALESLLTQVNEKIAETGSLQLNPKQEALLIGQAGLALINITNMLTSIGTLQFTTISKKLSALKDLYTKFSQGKITSFDLASVSKLKGELKIALQTAIKEKKLPKVKNSLILNFNKLNKINILGRENR